MIRAKMSSKNCIFIIFRIQVTNGEKKNPFSGKRKKGLIFRG